MQIHKTFYFCIATSGFFGLSVVSGGSHHGFHEDSFLLALVSSVFSACSSDSVTKNSESETLGARDDLLMSDAKLLQLRSYVDKAGFPSWDRNRATCIILCESAGRANARTGVHVGLFQINETYPGTEGGVESNTRLSPHGMPATDNVDIISKILR